MLVWQPTSHRANAGLSVDLDITDGLECTSDLWSIQLRIVPQMSIHCYKARWPYLATGGTLLGRKLVQVWNLESGLMEDDIDVTDAVTRQFVRKESFSLPSLANSLCEAVS